MPKVIKLKTTSRILLFILSLTAYLVAFLPASLHNQIDFLLGKELFRLRYFLKGREKIHSSFVVINVDDTDVATLGIRPFERRIFSDLIHILSVSEAKTLVLDMVFQNRIEPAVEKILVNRTREAGNVFFPFFLSNTAGTEAVKPELLDSFLREPVVLESGAPFQCHSFRLPFAELLTAAGGAGAIRLEPESDGISRRLPLLFAYRNRNEYIPSLVLKAACHYLDLPEEEMEVAFGKYILFPGNTENGRENRYIPIDRKGRMWINYSGPWRDSIEHRTLRDVLLLYAEDPEAVKELFTGTLVFVADISSDKQDYSRGIFDVSYPNSGVLSNALNTILTGHYLVEPGFLFSLSVCLCFICLAGITLYKTGIRELRLSLVCCFFLYMILSAVLFVRFNRIPRISLPLTGTILALAGSLVFKQTPAGALHSSAASAVTKPADLNRLSLISPIEIDEAACREYEITPAQRKLLKILQKGYTYKKTAEILGISENTVKKQISRIKEKANLYQKKDLLQLFFPLHPGKGK